jgi:type I restriction-modification system DNA methylase subunit
MTDILVKNNLKIKKQNLGIYYTPKEIVNFIFDILLIWKQKEDKEKKRWDLSHHYPSVIDPAVGEGVFLKTALEKGFTNRDFIFGLDIDEVVVDKWQELSLLNSFDNNMEKLKAHFFHQNGLDEIHWEQHINKYKYKLKSQDIKKQQFDCVVGNPPFGGTGIDFKKGDNKDSLNFVKRLQSYDIFTYKKAFSQLEIKTNDIQNNLFSVNETSNNSYFTHNKIAKLSESMPIEVLFLERFIQLAKPNGWIAIIVPDGILSNSNLDYVRKFIASKTKVEAIISMPRDTFKGTGTNAKTSILFLKKYEEEINLFNGTILDFNYPVFMATTDYINSNSLEKIRNSYVSYYLNNIK